LNDSASPVPVGPLSVRCIRGILRIRRRYAVKDREWGRDDERRYGQFVVDTRLRTGSGDEITDVDIAN
jgi:hypothetical protein